MAIFGVEGGIGCGKTLFIVHNLLRDLRSGKTVFTNIKLKNLRKDHQKKVRYLNKDLVNTMFEQIKTGKLRMENSTVGIQEIHNYMDSRTSMSKKNRTLSYWILQSRHTGKGSCDILFDTQDLGQADKRLRANTDYVVRPQIAALTVDGKPDLLLVIIMAKIGHRYRTFREVFEVSRDLDHYDTHEIVDF